MKGMYFMEKMGQFISEKNFYIIEENLGKHIAGYYHHTNGQKLIHVNSEIPRYYKELVIAYFLPKNTNICTQGDELSFLSMKNLQNMELAG